MKGYKGYNKGLICRGKQYAENTVFEEENAEICKSGMHFCENPFDVLEYYGYVNNKAELNEFTEVEALGDCLTDDNKKYTTKKLKIGAKLSIAGFCKAFVDFTFSKINWKNSAATNTGDCSAATNTGYMSAATNTGDYSAATNTGNRSAATNTGDCSAATVEGKNSFAIATGIESKAKGKLGCYIAVAEWENINGQWQIKNFKAHKVDGKTIKEDTFYTLKNGKFVIAK